MSGWWAAVRRSASVSVARVDGARRAATVVVLLSIVVSSLAGRATCALAERER